MGHWKNSFYKKIPCGKKIVKLEKQVYYISLFGIESIQEIYNSIITQNIVQKTHKYTSFINPKFLSTAVDLGIEKINNLVSNKNSKIQNLFNVTNSVVFL